MNLIRLDLGRTMKDRIQLNGACIEAVVPYLLGQPGVLGQGKKLMEPAAGEPLRWKKEPVRRFRTHNAGRGDSGFAKVDDHRLCQAFGLQDHIQGATSYPDCSYGQRGGLQTEENHQAEEKA